MLEVIDSVVLCDWLTFLGDLGDSSHIVNVLDTISGNITSSVNSVLPAFLRLILYFTFFPLESAAMQ